MFKLLVQKELRAIIQSPKFAVTLLVCSLLLMFSVFIGISEYRQAVTQYETAGDLARQSMEESTSWQSLSDKTYRKPEPLEVFVSGLGYDIGRWSEVSSEETVKLKHSAYSDDPIFAIFRIVDFTFIVQIVFSLFAILFTFDAINGERENGTLRLIFANSVPRAKYIMAKAVGSWLGLMAPLSIPILLSLLLVQIYSVPLSGTDWALLAVLIALSLLYVTLFVFFGVLMSTLSRHSSVSFLFSLVLWVAFVLIIPRAGVMAAGSIVDVPSLAEIEGIRGGFAKDRWAEYYAESERRWRDMNQNQDPSQDEESKEQNETAMWERMKEEDAARKMVQVQIEDYERKIMADWQHRKQAQQRFGFMLSRVSPASAYQLAAMKLTGTDIDLKSRYQSSISDYRNRFNDYVEARQAESGQQGGVMISISSEDGFKISTSRDNSGLDLAGKPEFVHPEETVPEVIEAVVVDFGLLALGTLLSFVGAFVAFLRYDMR